MVLPVVTPRVDASGARRRWVVLIALVLVSLVLWAWSVSFAGVPFGWVGLALLTSFAAAATALVMIARHHDEHHPLAVVAVISVALVLGGSVVTSTVPRTLRFEASRPALERLVAHRPITTVSCPASVGAYSVVECRPLGDGYLFLQRENALTDDSGIAWLPGGLTGEVLEFDRTGFTQLDGPWYRWTCNC